MVARLNRRRPIEYENVRGGPISSNDAANGTEFVDLGKGSRNLTEENGASGKTGVDKEPEFIEGS